MKRTGAPKGEREGQIPCGKVLVNELVEGGKFLLGQGVNRTKRQDGALVQSDLEIIWSMVS